jgi:hypothetical protein
MNMRTISTRVNWLTTLGALALFGAQPVQAMLVTHSTQGTLFDETYESQIVGTTPTTPLIDPDGHGESWGSSFTGSPIGSTLTWDVASGGPAANEGDQYVRLQRVSGGTTNLVGNWDAPGAPVAVTSGDLTFQFAVYIPEGAPTQALSFVVDELTGNANPNPDGITSKALELTTIVDGANLRIGRLDPTGNFYINTALFYQTNTWQDWTIVYHLSDPSGAETYDLTIDGNTDAGLPALIDVAGLQRFYMRAANNNSVAFVDAQNVVIPEPASAALLAAGGLMLVRRRQV